jgi:hypothetical protein
LGSSTTNTGLGANTGEGPVVKPPSDMVEWTAIVWGSYPSCAKLIVKSPAVPMAIVQGVGQVPPSDDLASTPGGLDWIRSAAVVGFALNASKPGIVEEPQAASPKPQITNAKDLSSFLSAFPRVAESGIRLPHRFAPGAF